MSRETQAMLRKGTFRVETEIWLAPKSIGNLGTRLVKSSKVMLGDTGLLCYLLGLDIEHLKNDALMTGAVLESFAGIELAKQITWSEARPALFHFRTHTQHEVDFVMEDAAGHLVGIEVKKSASPTSNDFKCLHHFRDAVGKRFLRGVILYMGCSSVAFGPNMHVVPVSALWRMMK